MIIWVFSDRKTIFHFVSKKNHLRRIYFCRENKSKYRYDLFIYLFFLIKKKIVSVSCKPQLTTKSRYNLFLFLFSFFGGRQFLRKWTNAHSLPPAKLPPPPSWPPPPSRCHRHAAAAYAASAADAAPHRPLRRLRRRLC